MTCISYWKICSMTYISYWKFALCHILGIGNLLYVMYEIENFALWIRLKIS
jgi:hypothetical protein